MPDESWDEYSKLVLHELQRLNGELANVVKEQRRQNECLSEYNAHLREHIAGVRLLDEKTDMMRDEMKILEARMDVVEVPLQWFKGTTALAGLMGAVVGGLGVLWAAFQYLSKKFTP